MGTARHITLVNTVQLTRTYRENEGLPLKSLSDGNCLFSSASIALTGNNSLATEIRVRTCIEMLVNKELYTNLPNSRDILMTSPSFDDSCLDCGTSHGFSSQWTIYALSNAVKSTINVVYPPMNGPDDFVHRVLNTTCSSRDATNKTFTITWTSCAGTIPNNRTWSSNHFVPLIVDSEKNLNFTSNSNSKHKESKLDDLNDMDDTIKAPIHLHAPNRHGEANNERFDREELQMTSSPIKLHEESDLSDVRDEVSNVITVSRQRFDSKSYLLKVNRKEHVKPVLICNWKSCRFGDDVFLENKRIRKDRDKIKEVLAAKFEFENKDQNFHLLDNLEEDNLLEELKKIAQEIRTSGQRRPDMFVCFMFGFGGTDFFFDIRIDRTDSRKVTFKQIMDVFNGTNCPGLVMRPKLFFIQTERKKIDIPLSNLFHVYGSSPQYFGSMKSVPVESDFFVYSSTHIWEGDRSPFTDRLVEGFKIWDGQHDIMEVTLSVNKDIKNDMGQAFVPICTCQLTKQLKFFDFSKTDVDMQ